jgi:hypothetical protein
MLCDATKLTRMPTNMTPTDIDILLKVSFNATPIRVTARIVAHFSYDDRLVDRLGISLEE